MKTILFGITAVAVGVGSFANAEDSNRSVRSEGQMKEHREARREKMQNCLKNKLSPEDFEAAQKLLPSGAPKQSPQFEVKGARPPFLDPNDQSAAAQALRACHQEMHAARKSDVSR